MQLTRSYKVPGRINLIGEHTDYNLGFVLPGAVDQFLIFKVEEIEGPEFQFHSGYFNQDDSCDVFGQGAKHNWSRFFCQVIRVLSERKYPIRPIKCSFDGNLPIGAGMSSSSALSCGLIFSLDDIFDLRISKRDMVFLASEAENSSGLDGGKMDQYSILFGEEGQLLKIDCRDYTHELVHASLVNHAIVLFDTKVEHTLIDTEYNDRHAECKQGLAKLNALGENISSVRDIKRKVLDAYQQEMGPVLYRRLSYVLDENDRVERAVAAIELENWHEVGALMYQSHQGLQHEYEVSCEELNFIVEWSRSNEAVLGARMMGGGFGGCVIAIVDMNQIDDIVEELKGAYKKEFGFFPGYYPVRISRGIHRIA